MRTICLCILLSWFLKKFGFLCSFSKWIGVTTRSSNIDQTRILGLIFLRKGDATSAAERTFFIVIIKHPTTKIEENFECNIIFISSMCLVSPHYHIRSPAQNNAIWANLYARTFSTPNLNWSISTYRGCSWQRRRYILAYARVGSSAIKR